MASNKKGNEKNNLEPLKKDDFIKFIASSSPKEINEFITDMNAEVEDLKEIKELGQNLVDLADKAIEQL